MDFSLPALFGALALFWLSTRQFPLLVRGLIWLGGAGVLAWAAFGQPKHPDFGLWQTIGDSFRNGDLSLVRALRLNASMVLPFLQQLRDFFLVATAFLAALALASFTRGEALERALRPTILAVLGFIAGSVATLAVVAVGFGGYARPRVFTSDGNDVRVHDGDTFWMRENSLRLFGADAPEEGQTCRGLGDPACGAAARTHLSELIVGHTLQCDQMLSRERQRPRDTFGRALVRCWTIQNDGSRTDVAERIIRDGYAVQFRGDDNYGYGDAEDAARSLRSGLLSGCTLRPDIWRSLSNDEEVAFLGNALIPREAHIMGDCSRWQATQ